MKKKLVITGKLLTAGILSTMLLFTSCQKEPVEVVENKQQKVDTETLTNVERLTADFIREQQISAENQDRIPGWLKRLAKHVYNDLKGGAAGAKVGSLFGPTGTWIGAGIGAAAGTLSGMSASDGVSPDDGAAVNPENALDNAGTSHNDLLYEGFTHNYDVIYSGGVLSASDYRSFAESYLVDNGYAGPTEVTVYTDAQLNSDLNFIAIHEALDMTDYVDVCEAEGIMSSAERDLLHLYYEAMESSVSVSDFIAYSVSVEEEITTSGYEESVKNYVLSCMSVTRQDVHFWDMNIPE